MARYRQHFHKPTKNYADIEPIQILFGRLVGMQKSGDQQKKGLVLPRNKDLWCFLKQLWTEL